MLDIFFNVSLAALMIAYTVVIAVNNNNASNVDTTAVMSDEAPSWRLFNIAVSSPNIAMLSYYDYSSLECNASLAEIGVGAPVSEGGLGFFEHSPIMAQYFPNPNLTSDSAAAPQALNAYIQPVPSPFNTNATLFPNDLDQNDPRNYYGNAGGCVPGINCYSGNPWLQPSSQQPTNMADGSLLRTFTNVGLGVEAPIPPPSQAGAIGGMQQCEIWGQINYTDPTRGSTTAFRHERFALLPMCYLTSMEQSTSCKSDFNGRTIDTANTLNRCRERGIFRTSVALLLSNYQLDFNDQIVSGDADEFGNKPQIYFTFPDSDTSQINPSAFDLSQSGDYRLTFQLTVTDDETQPAPPKPVLQQLCDYLGALSGAEQDRDAASNTRQLTLISVEYTPNLRVSANTIGEYNQYIFVHFGISPVWFKRTIKSGSVSTLQILASIGGAFSILFPLIRILRKIVQLVLLNMYRFYLNHRSVDPAPHELPVHTQQYHPPIHRKQSLPPQKISLQPERQNSDSRNEGDVAVPSAGLDTEENSYSAATQRQVTFVDHEGGKTVMMLPETGTE